MWKHLKFCLNLRYSFSAAGVDLKVAMFIKPFQVLGKHFLQIYRMKTNWNLQVKPNINNKILRWLVNYQLATSFLVEVGLEVLLGLVLGHWLGTWVMVTQDIRLGQS
jgi:hypothetical protein